MQNPFFFGSLEVVCKGFQTLSLAKTGEDEPTPLQISLSYRMVNYVITFVHYSQCSLNIHLYTSSDSIMRLSFLFFPLFSPPTNLDLLRRVGQLDNAALYVASPSVFLLLLLQIPLQQSAFVK